jgi:predicted nuclease of predicted toxin-antitoxin system
MKFIADENIPFNLITRLRCDNYDVLSVKETMESASDKEIMAVSQNEERIIITQDKDFGELVFRTKSYQCTGVILFRSTSPSPEEDSKLMYSAITSRNDWINQFPVITERHIRIRPLLR